VVTVEDDMEELGRAVAEIRNRLESVDYVRLCGNVNPDA
jgi:hypothetical protein